MAWGRETGWGGERWRGEERLDGRREMVWGRDTGWGGERQDESLERSRLKPYHTVCINWVVC